MIEGGWKTDSQLVDLSLSQAVFFLVVLYLVPSLSLVTEGIIGKSAAFSSH